MGGHFQLTRAWDDHHCPHLFTNLWPKYAPDMGWLQFFAVKPELPPHLTYFSLNTHTIPHVSLGFACPGANQGEPDSQHTYVTYSPGDGSSP